MKYNPIAHKNQKKKIQHYENAYIKVEKEDDRKFFEFCHFTDCLIETDTIYFTNCHFNNCKIITPTDSYVFITQCSVGLTTVNAEKALVLAIEDSCGNPIKEATNNYYVDLITYTIGEMVYPDAYDDSREKTCTNGIHFFMTKEEAKNYID